MARGSGDCARAASPLRLHLAMSEPRICGHEKALEGADEAFLNLPVCTLSDKKAIFQEMFEP